MKPSQTLFTMATTSVRLGIRALDDVAKWKRFLARVSDSPDAGYYRNMAETKRSLAVRHLAEAQALVDGAKALQNIGQ